MKILDGKNLSAKIKDELKGSIQSNLKTPILAVITVGYNEASYIYVNNKKKACEYVGMSLMHFDYSEDEPEEKIIKKIKELKKDENVNGIIIQLPIPDKYDTRKLLNTISPSKDVDGLTDISLGKILEGNSEFIPCTPKGIIELLDFYKIKFEGKHVVVVGRSNLVGKPVMLECLKRNATCTICHSKTKNLKRYTLDADILIVAVGKKHVIKENMIKKNAVVVDVGINRVDGKIYGDVVDTDICSYKTPVPGGVGPMTVAMLLKNTYIAYKNQNGIKDEE